MSWTEFKARIDELMEKEGIDPGARIHYIDIIDPEIEGWGEVEVFLDRNGQICI